MAGMDTIVGSGSLLADDFYLRKYEKTSMYESPSLMYDYNRSELKKEGPVQAFFESDMKRTNYDTSGRMALREGGKRSQSEPWLPDGTFLDQQFVAKDPRSIMYQPDMRNHIKQQYTRGKNYRYNSDADNSVPETAIHPTYYRQLIRETQDQAKERMNIFSTSQVGWHNGGATQKLLTAPHPVDSTIRDSETSTVSDFTLENRSGKTNSLSNNTIVGWRQTVDHEFKVAHYGQKRGARAFADLDYYKNRGSTKLDQESDYVYVEDSPVPKATAELIIDLSSKRANTMEAASHIKFNDGQNCILAKKKLSQPDMIKVHEYVNFSQNNTSHNKLDILSQNNPGKQTQGCDNIQRYSVINPKIIEKIALINRNMASRDRDDLRDEIHQTAKTSGVCRPCANTTRMNVETLDPTLGKRDVIYNFKRGDDKIIHVYGQNTSQRVGSEMSRVAYENRKSKSAENGQRRRNLDPSKIQQTTDHEYDTEINTFGPTWVGSKGCMNKTRAKYMNIKDHTMHDSDISEMNSSVRR